MVQSTDGCLTRHNFQNPVGRRIYKSSPTVAGIFVYDGFNLIETVNPSGAKMGDHYHIQTVPGPGGAQGLLPRGCDCPDPK
jgi:hypothetical protein